MTVLEVAERYRYTDETVWKKCRQYSEGDRRGWPHQREGRSIRFSEADIVAIDEKFKPQIATNQPKRKRRALAA
ncbi:hypothetical protein JOE65_000739 [Arthrobacter roseus]|nr:hypothetical protein [Arthrobacter roseus]